MTPVPKPIPNDDGLWSPKRRALTIGLVLTITLVAFEALAVSTVLPIVADELGDKQLYGWVFSAFLLGSLIGIAVVGGIIEGRGLARPLAAGLGLFAIGLLIGGLAPTMQVLIFGRFIQGLGAGAIPPIAYVAIGRSLPERLRPRMFATLSTAWVLPGVMGPALAGVIGEFFGWRYVFLGLLPLIAVAGALTYLALSTMPATETAEAAEHQAGEESRRRVPYALLIAAGAGLIMAGLTSGEAPLIIGLSILGLALLIPGLRRLTPPGTLTARPVLPAAVLERGLLTFMFFGIDAYVSLTLEDHRGLSAIAAGIALTAATISWTAGSWIQARGAERWSTDRFVRAGFIVTLIGLATFSLVLIPEVPVWARGADLRHRRPGHGSRLRATLAHRPARGAARDPGRGLERAQPARHARHGPRDRHQRRHRRREPADDRRPGPGPRRRLPRRDGGGPGRSQLDRTPTPAGDRARPRLSGAFGRQPWLSQAARAPSVEKGSGCQV